jgi:hypothetical protein
MDVPVRFDLTSYHSLLQAFDLAGRRMFGTAWRGDEAFARRTDDPQATGSERRDILDRIKVLAGEAQSHNVIMGVEAGEDAHQSASDALHKINAELDDLKRQLTGVPDVTDAWVEDFEAYSRRRQVERELSGAFDRGELQLQVGISEIVQWRSWSRLPDFKVYFNLSIVRLPLAHTGQRRRAPAFVARATLEQWLDRFETNATAEATLTPHARAQVWLKDKMRQHEPKQYPKSEYRALAMSDISGLTARTFDTAWDQTVPESWRRSGRRPKKTTP